MRPARAHHSVAGFAVVASLLAACGPSLVPLRTATVPGALSSRQAALHGLGRALFASLEAGMPERVLFDDLALRSLLDSAGASRANAIRQTAGPGLRAQRDALALALRGSSYLGVCLQESSVEGPGGPLGLRENAWIVARVFLVAQDPRQGRLAGWVEGSFVFTSRGFGAIAIDRVEPARPAHSDLELASCEMAAGLEEP